MEKILSALEGALRTLTGTPHLTDLSLEAHGDDKEIVLSFEERHLSCALMRVNHVGEVCAQALYTGQALTSRNPLLRRHYQTACEEETPHLAWTSARLAALGGRQSALNPLWYLGSFVLGVAAGRMSDGVSLGFVAETERQVGRHLHSHLTLLPKRDTVSRVIVAQMQRDEAKHAKDAIDMGAIKLPWFVRQWMRVNAKIMTTVAHYI